MIDIKLYTDTSDPRSWAFDINIEEDGNVSLLDFEYQNADQRAALMAYIQTGTIPGQWDLGVNWAGVTTGEITVIDINDQISRNILEYVADGTSIENTYTPILYGTSEDVPTIGAYIIKGLGK